MPIFNEKEFFPIFAKVLVVGQSYPFDTYILLPLAKKVILFISSQTPVTQEKMDKLSEYKHRVVYIKAIDRNSYYQNLDKYLETQQGQIELKNQLNSGSSPGELGIPDRSEYVLSNFHQDGEVKDEILGGITEIVNKKAKELAEKIQIKDQFLEDDKLIIKNVTDHIKDELIKLESNQLPEAEQKQVIGNVTLKIKDEIQKLKSVGSNNPKLAKTIAQVIADLNQNLEQLEQKKSLQEGLAECQSLKTGIKSLMTIVSDRREDVVADTLQDMIKSVEEKLGTKLNLKINAVEIIDEKPKDNGVVDANAVGAAPSSVPSSASTVVGAVASDGVGVSDGAGVAVTPTMVDEKLIEELKIILKSQEKTIQDLTEKLKQTRPEFENLRDRWLTFQMLTKKKLDATDNMKARAISQQMQEFESQFFRGFNNERKNLKKLTKKFYSILNNEIEGNESNNETDGSVGPVEAESNSPIDADDVAIIGAAASATSDNSENSKDQVSADGAAAAGGDGNNSEGAGRGAESAVGRTSSAAEIESLMSENKVLQVQLENAQALIETTNKKVFELEEMVKGSGSYANTMEEELFESKKKIEKLLDEVQTYESEKRRLSEDIEDVNTNLHKKQIGEDASSQKVTILNQRILELEKSLGEYKSDLGNDAIVSANLSEQPDTDKMSVAAKALFFRKEEMIKSLNHALLKKTDELQNIKSEFENYKKEDRKFDLEKKDLSKRLEKQRVEIENINQHQKTIELKNTSTTNLLAQARKTINKLTDENTELRQDRTKYIKKTNDALAEHKSLINQAISLNSQVQVEFNRKKEIEEQLLEVKDREKSLSKQIQQLQTQLNTSEKEKKRIEQQFKKASNEESDSGATAYKVKISELEKKIELFKNENKELQKNFVSEQKKVTELVQKLNKKAS